MNYEYFYWDHLENTIFIFSISFIFVVLTSMLLNLLFGDLDLEDPWQVCVL